VKKKKKKRGGIRAYNKFKSVILARRREERRGNHMGKKYKGVTGKGEKKPWPVHLAPDALPKKEDVNRHERKGEDQKERKTTLPRSLLPVFCREGGEKRGGKRGRAGRKEEKRRITLSICGREKKKGRRM